MEPIAYLTVEIKHREFESRLLIAAHMLAAGFPVVVGQQWSLFMNADALPQGVILFKTVNDIQANNMANFRKAGHLVAATDEEVLVCMDDPGYLLAFGATAASNCDLFLAQNAHQRDAIVRRFPDLADRIEVVGNPRIDLLAPRGRATFAREAEAIRQEHGPFVLFNTNYGSINSIWKDSKAVLAIAARAGAFDPEDKESVRTFEALLEWERKNYEEMLPLVSWAIKNLPRHKIVLRPHPGEAPDYWHKVLAGAANTLVVPRSNPHPWIMASDLVVHTGCTTGLEAALLGKPSANVAPAKHPLFERLVNFANPKFEKWQDAAVAITAFLDHGNGPIVENRAAYERVLSEYFPGYSDGDSAKIMAGKLIELLVKHGAQPSSTYKPKLRNKFHQADRHPTLRDKMSVGQDEFIAMFENVRRNYGLKTPAKLLELDESLYLLRPT